MQTIAIIPARGGSRRLPGKNIKLLGGMPLIAHSILYAKKNVDIIDEVFVSTDDSEIKSVSLDYGAKVIDRPAAISGDNEPTVTALIHVLQQLPQPIDTIVLLQATNPFRPLDLLKNSFNKYKEFAYDSVFSVTRNFQKFGRIVNDKFVPFNYTIGQRSQDLEPLYFENGLMYITKSKTILNGTVVGENNCPIIVNHPYAHIDIDTEDDFAQAEYIFKNKI